jgi:Bacterial PH domain
MSVGLNQFMSKVFVGAPVDIGTFFEPYRGLLLDEEVVEIEFKGMRDGMVFTNLRVIVVNNQGFTGKKTQASSFAWKAMTAFSIENSSTFDFEAEIKFCGSG